MGCLGLEMNFENFCDVLEIFIDGIILVVIKGVFMISGLGIVFFGFW